MEGDRILQVNSEMVAQEFCSPVCSIMILDAEKQELAIKASAGMLLPR